MNKIDPEVVRARIRKVACRDMELPEPVAEDIAFHMTDWLTDLDIYSRFCADPSKMSDAEVSEMLTNFLVHVPNHIAAASKLCTGVPVTDIFSVGATSEDTHDA
jgi:hypothetical protein